ncbi:MAG: hypothetical protein JRF64_02035 [Deltaproteobacteria bacterium]|nr:hypothetical protein [Deltaproteobacteria bacterium]MBW2173427.1 hypothetical protein [Deltaproteobacteria bacterium]MBW2566203.1 hypothetical protein [Deltaproteobacteria bacterium]
MTSCKSNFVKEKIPLLLSRFDLCYYREDNCVEYFIADKATNKEISRAVILSLNRGSKEINVGRFCPELYKQTECKYLSAACFYLLTHHFANIYHIPKSYRIHLETRPVTYRKFFAKLRDFDLHVEGLKLCKSAEVCGNYPQLDIDVSLIKEKVMENGEVPFMV